MKKKEEQERNIVSHAIDMLLLLARLMFEAAMPAYITANDCCVSVFQFYYSLSSEPADIIQKR